MFYHDTHKIMKKKYFFFVHSIKMSNINQTNEIKHINKEISLLHDRLKINETSLNQFQNGLMQIGRIRVKQGQRTFSNQKNTKNFESYIQK